MGQLFRFSNRNNPQKSNEFIRVRSGSAIRFDGLLVAKLQEDHKKLLSIYANIQDAIIRHDLVDIDKNLTNFRTELQTHLLTENIRLYAYLTQKFSADPTNSEIIQDFRQEMYGIGHAVMGFLRKYRNMPLDGRMLGTFKKELDEIGAVLVTRIRHEESTLYPLYQY